MPIRTRELGIVFVSCLPAATVKCRHANRYPHFETAEGRKFRSGISGKIKKGVSKGAPWAGHALGIAFGLVNLFTPDDRDAKNTYKYEGQIRRGVETFVPNPFDIIRTTVVNPLGDKWLAWYKRGMAGHWN